MESKLITRLIASVFIALFSLAVFLPSLGSVSFWDSDEARYAVCARNAIEHGKWLIPEYNGHPRIAKPPLMTWLAALSSLLLNKGEVTEFTARLPSVLAAVGTALVVFLLAEALFGSLLVSMLSSFILITCHLFYKQARFSITDMVLTFFFTLGLFFFYKFSISKGKRRKVFILLMYFSFAMATMDKGPVVGLILPFIIIFFYVWGERAWALLRELFFLPGIALYLLLVLPWPIGVGSAYLKAFLWKSNVKRFASNPSWKTPPYFYLYNFPFQFSPWSSFIPLFSEALRKRGLEPFREKVSFPLVWFTVVFVLFSISDTKRSSYILPLYPAAALLGAWAIGKGVELSEELKSTWRISLTLFGLTTIGYPLIFTFVMARHLPLYVPTATASLGLAVIVVSFLFLLTKLGHHQEALTLVCASALLFSIGYTGYYQPIFDKGYRSPKPYCLDIRERVDGLPLYHYGSIRAHDIFYIGLRRIPSWRKSAPKGSYVMTKLKNWKKLKPSLREKFQIVKEYKFRNTKIFLLKWELGRAFKASAGT